MNRVAEEKLLTIWWFFVLALIGVGLVSGAMVFYGNGVNVKEIEAGVLSNKIILCLDNLNLLNDNFFSNEFNFYKECGLNKEIIEKSFYIKIDFYLGSENFKSNVYGNPSIAEDCKITKLISTKSFPVCSNGEIKLYSNLKKDFVIVKINTGSKNDGGKFVL